MLLKIVGRIQLNACFPLLICRSEFTYLTLNARTTAAEIRSSLDLDEPQSCGCEWILRSPVWIIAKFFGAEAFPQLLQPSFVLHLNLALYLFKSAFEQRETGR